MIEYGWIAVYVNSHAEAEINTQFFCEINYLSAPDSIFMRKVLISIHILAVFTSYKYCNVRVGWAKLAFLITMRTGTSGGAAIMSDSLITRLVACACTDRSEPV